MQDIPKIATLSLEFEDFDTMHLKRIREIGVLFWVKNNPWNSESVGRTYYKI